MFSALTSASYIVRKTSVGKLMAVFQQCLAGEVENIIPLILYAFPQLYVIKWQ